MKEQNWINDIKVYEIDKFIVLNHSFMKIYPIKPILSLNLFKISKIHEFIDFIGHFWVFITYTYLLIRDKNKILIF